MLNMQHARQLLVGATVFFIICSCATKPPSIFLAVYGEYETQSTRVLRVVNNAVGTEVVNVIDVHLPNGARGPVIIHGSDAKTLADEIAFALYTEFGELVAVYPLNMGNHSYSNNRIGIYLADANFEFASDIKVQQSVSKIPSNNYLPADCSNFDGSLTLLADGQFEISGSSYDLSSNETKISRRGSYVRTEGLLELTMLTETYVYVEEPLQWSGLPEGLTKLVPLKSNSQHSEPFDCGFIQDVDVISKPVLESEHGAGTN